MQQKKIIGIIGEQASGKGAAADIIRKNYGGSRLTVSSILRRTLDSLHLEPSRDNLVNIALVLKKGFGNDVLMKAMIKDIEKEDTDLVIVDGFRMPGDPEEMRAAFEENFTFIYVTADQRTRYERSVGRGEKAGESEATFEEFQSKESLETEAKIAEVAKSADYVITNDGGVEELEKKIVEIMNKI
jgi:dephospho-CoA kinase